MKYCQAEGEDYEAASKYRQAEGRYVKAEGKEYQTEGKYRQVERKDYDTAGMYAWAAASPRPSALQGEGRGEACIGRMDSTVKTEPPIKLGV